MTSIEYKEYYTLSSVTKNKLFESISSTEVISRVFEEAKTNDDIYIVHELPSNKVLIRFQSNNGKLEVYKEFTFNKSN